jgi:hypothetical protein
MFGDLRPFFAVSRRDEVIGAILFSLFATGLFILTAQLRPEWQPLVRVCTVSVTGLFLVAAIHLTRLGLQGVNEHFPLPRSYVPQILYVIVMASIAAGGATLMLFVGAWINSQLPK